MNQPSETAAPRGRLSQRTRARGYISSYDAARIVEVPYRVLKEWLAAQLVPGAERSGPKGVWRIKAEALTADVVEQLRARDRRRVAGLGDPEAQRALPVDDHRKPARPGAVAAAVAKEKLAPLEARVEQIEAALRSHPHQAVTGAELDGGLGRKAYESPAVVAEGDRHPGTGLPNVEVHIDGSPWTPEAAATIADIVRSAPADVRMPPAARPPAYHPMPILEAEEDESIPDVPPPMGPSVPAWVIAAAAGVLAGGVGAWLLGLAR